jgi:hypothetical protein
VLSSLETPDRPALFITIHVFLRDVLGFSYVFKRTGSGIVIPLI